MQAFARQTGGRRVRQGRRCLGALRSLQLPGRTMHHVAVVRFARQGNHPQGGCLLLLWRSALGDLDIGIFEVPG